MLNGKTAVITGASRGIGRAIAEKFGSLVANLVLNAVNEKTLFAFRDELTARGIKAVAVAADISSPDTALKLITAAEENFGGVDIAVNCAGITMDGMLHKMTDERWDRVIAVNLTGTFYLTRAAAQVMRAKKSGRIINISSVMAAGNLGQANYAASKAGVIALTKSAAKELARCGVTCNAICPGVIETDMTAVIPEGAKQALTAKIPAETMGKPEDIAAAAAFLASDEAGYITGDVMYITGGMTV